MLDAAAALRVVLAALLVVLAGGCSLFAAPVAPPACGFPAEAQLSFAGEASLAGLGLGDGSIVAGGGITDNTVGAIYVSRDAIPFTGSVPMTADGPAEVPDFRQYCAIYPDATALGGVPDDWQPPQAR